MKNELKVHARGLISGLEATLAANNAESDKVAAQAAKESNIHHTLYFKNGKRGKGFVFGSGRFCLEQG